MSEVRLDARDMKIRPCFTCEEAIREAVFADTLDEEDIEFMSMSLDEYVEKFE